MQPNTRVLLIDTNRWPLVARVAIALRNMGCAVALACPTPGHPALELEEVEQIYLYNGLRPISSLQRAIREFRPSAVIPFCDRSVEHLHRLYTRASSEESESCEASRVIETSLGDPSRYSVTQSRFALLKLAEEEGIRVPRTDKLPARDNFPSAHSEFRYPCVVKVDGSWGGRGVRVIGSTDELDRLMDSSFVRPSILRLVRALLLNRGYDWILHDWAQPPRSAVIQEYIEGRPANCSIVAWKGEVLAGIAVEVVRSRSASGPASVVHVVQGDEMMAAAVKIARRLGMSGFFGLDFMIHVETGRSYLIEMNPRCTPPCHLPLPGGRDLIAAYYACLAGAPPKTSRAAIPQTVIEYTTEAIQTGELTHRIGEATEVYRDISDCPPMLLRRLQYPYRNRTLLGEWIDKIGGKGKRTRKDMIFWPTADSSSQKTRSCATGE